MSTEINYNKTKSNPFDYFYNEKGDYTVTLYDKPVAIVQTEADAINIKNVVSSLTLRNDVLTSMIKELSFHNDIMIKALEEGISYLNCGEILEGEEYLLHVFERSIHQYKL